VVSGVVEPVSKQLLAEMDGFKRRIKEVSSRVQDY
jgi:hypothetical protein